MKLQLKHLLATAAFALWAGTANAHHAAGQVVCNDTTPPRPLSGIVVTIRGDQGTTYTDTTDAEGAYGVNLPVITETYTITIATPPGLALVSPATGQYVSTIFADGLGGPNSIDGANFGLVGCVTPLARIGDLVFNDSNANGVQETGENGVNGVTAELFRCSDNSLVATTTTSGGGLYGFSVPAGSYYVKFSNLPAGYAFSPSSPGLASDPTDSDANPATGVTDCTELTAGEIDPTWDAGIYPPARIGDLVFNDTDADGVQDVGETGVNGVTVELFRCSDNSLVATTTTSGGGIYGFGVAAGSYYVRFSNLPVGYTFSPSTPSTASDPTDSDANASGITGCTELVPGENDITWDAGIYPPARIGDLVFNDTDADGVQDAGETGVNGVTVELFRCSDNGLVATTTTASGGLYGFSVAPGSYYVKFSNLPVGYVFSPSTAGPASDPADSDANPAGVTDCTDVTPGENDPTWDAGIYEPARIGDLVFNDTNANGVQDAGETGVNGVTVQLFRCSDNGLVATTATSGGLYGFTVTPGSYYVRFSNLPIGYVFSPSIPGPASDPNDSDANPAGVTDCTDVTPGENDSTWDAGIYQPARIGDLVFNDTNANGVQDAGETGVNGVTVELFRCSDNGLVASTTTASGGLYGFTVTPGSYYVRFSNLPVGAVFSPSTPGLASDPTDSDANAAGVTDCTEVTAGETDSTWDAGIYQPARIGDLVFNDTNANGVQDAGETGVNGVTVDLIRCSDNSLVGTALTAGGGLYGFTVPPGNYYVKFANLPDGYALSPSTPGPASDPNDSDANLSGATDCTELTSGENDPTWDAGIYLQTARIGDLVFNDVNTNGVQDAGEVGVDGVRVELYRCSDTVLVATATTAGGGLYGFEIAPGSYFVRFSNLPAGYVFSPSVPGTASDPNDSDASSAGVTDCTELAGGENDPTWDAGIYRRIARIGDLVFNDTNANGVQEAGEVGVDGVRVELFRCADDAPVGTAVTTGGGAYHFDVAPGQYYVRFSNLPAGYVFSPSSPSPASDATDSDANPMTGRTDCVELAPGQNDPTWDAGIYRPAQIGDLVFNDTNANGVQDAGETGVVGVRVELFRCSDNALVGTTVTIVGGAYGFEIAPGSYYVKFSNLPAGYVLSPSTPGLASDPNDSDANAAGLTDCTELTAGENDPTWDAGIYQPARIGDLVFNDTDADGVQDAGETGVNGVTVELFRCSDNALMGTTATSGGGIYGFTVAPGSYYAKFSNLPAGYVFSPSTASTASDPSDSDASAAGVTGCTELVPGENDITWDAGIYQPARIGDLVFNDTDADGVQDAGETGVNGVTVELFRCSDNALMGTTATSGGGIYGFTVAPGSYYVKFSNLPAGYVFSPSTASTASDPSDSDASAAGITGCTELVAGENDITWDAGIYQPARIGDLVFKDTDADGVQDAGETGVNGVTVELFRCSDNALMGTTATSGGGIYGFTAAPGSYYVKFSNLPAGYVFSPSTASTASDPSDSDASAAGITGCTELVAGENDITWDAGIYQPARIGDLVFKDTDADGVQDAGETGVNGVTVELFRCSDNALMGTTATSGGGIYGFTVAPGSYYVKFSNLPAGYVFSPSTASTASDPNDSDANAAGVTGCTELVAGENDITWDAGIYQPSACVPVTIATTGATGTSGSAGNIRTFSAGGVTVKASAFSRLKSTATWATAFLGAYSSGVGVTDGSEGDGSNDRHVVDNIDRNNYVMFEFSEPVVLNRVFLGYVSDDSDLSVWIGTFTDPINNHLSLNDTVLGRFGFTEANEATNSLTRWADLNAGEVVGNVVVIAADITDTTPDDQFKIQTLDICRPRVQALASIGDKVWNDTNANGTQDAGETGVDGVKVELFRCSDAALVRSTNTSGGGLYTFAVAPGSYYVKFSNLPSGYRFSPSTAGTTSDAGDSDANATSGVTDCTDLIAGENDPTWDAGIYKPATIGDFVFNDTNTNGTQNAGEPGVDGVKVELLRCADNAVVGTTTTSGGGRYSFTVAPGDYYVKFSNLPAGYVFSPSTAGTASDPSDSDANRSSGRTDCTSLASGENDPTWDAGIYAPAACVPVSIATTGTTGTSGSAGNIRTFSSGGVSVKASAFSRTRSTGSWAPAYLGAYDVGLGVTDSSEGTGSNDRHLIDNVDRVNYVLFEFSEPVVLSRLFLGYVITDSDLNVWIGTFTDPFNSHLTLSDTVLGRFGFTEESLSDNGLTRWADVNGGEVVGNAIVVAASLSDTTPDDQFKIQTLDVCRRGAPPAVATIGDKVWHDANGNGVQDSGEAGVDGVKVELFRCVTNTLVATSTTAGGGRYSFTVAAGDYYVKFSNLPVGYAFSPSTAGSGSDANDSDANPTTGRTDCTTLAAGENDPTWDAGIYRPTVCEPVTITTIGATATSGSAGNIRTFSASGVTVKASAFSRVKSTGAWAPAYLGAYSIGLGVTDGSEADGSNNRHVLDNIDRDNFVLFEFSEPVVLNRAYLGYVLSDSDLNVWIGTFNNPINNHLNLSDAVLSRFGHTEENIADTAAVRWADVNAGNVVGNAVVISAWLGDTTPEDQFKIQALDICRAGWVNPAGTETEPEPFLYMAAPQLSADGLFQAEVTAIGVASYVIESSSNLVHWTPVTTGTTETLQFVDPVPPSGERRFYRLRALQ